LYDQTSHTFVCILKKGNISLLFPLLQQGFQFAAKVGCKIQSLLCDQFKIVPEFKTDRITSVFLNDKAVGDVSSAVVYNGANRSLSLVLPGLVVGATFRKTSCLASFRGDITHQSETNRSVVCSDGWIMIKLFNLLLGELGPIFLNNGIRIEGAALQDCFTDLQVNKQAVFEMITAEAGN
jgi:hypothetical protein